MGLLKRNPLSVSLLEEPELVFGHDQPSIDPKLGIYNFGPFSVSNQNRHPTQIRLGIIGSGETLALARAWLTRVANRIEPVVAIRKRVAPFPGFATSVGPFNCSFVVDPACLRTLTDLEIRAVTEMVDRRRMFQQGLDLLTNRVKMIADDHQPDVILVALPRTLYDACRAVGGPSDRSSQPTFTPAERALMRMAKRQARSQQSVLFEDMYKVDGQDELVYRNFRRALKAAVMKSKVPIQIMRPNSFYDEEGLPNLAEKLSALKRQGVQEPATRAWNFCSAMYFKANGVPWRLANAAPGTCFVGVSFFRHDTVVNPHMHTSLGQVFTDQGDALVVRGERFEWDVAKQGSPHLTYTLAARLVEQVLAVYDAHVHVPPSKLVLHKTSRFTEDERRGFIDAIRAAKVSQYDLVTLYSRGVRLFRAGTYPPARGTLVRIPDGGALLYTMGYIPSLDYYPKGHVPRPLEIVERYGDSDLGTVCAEILGLTKLNWNSADFASAEPITLRFARSVAHVLTELEDGDEPHPHYRFYV